MANDFDGFIENNEHTPLSAEIIKQLKTPASSRLHMANTFARRFDVKVASECRDQWWLDLLALWRPSGVPAGETGLRLAVRNGYLNFYRKGQSVARVEAKKGQLVAEVHYKYVFPDTVVKPKQNYVRLSGSVLSLDGDVVGTYGANMDVTAWLKAAERKSGAEKNAIDDVLDYSDNVIDLEMGQPRTALRSTALRRTALRMDMVAIEEDGGQHYVAFWEAKLANDGRVRRSGPLKSDDDKFVLYQLKQYSDFINSPDNMDRVAVAYQTSAKVLMELRAVADRYGPAHPLGRDIVAAASVPLSVRPNARLLILKPDDRAWPVHAQKLIDAGVEMVVMDPPSKLSWSPTA